MECKYTYKCQHSHLNVQVSIVATSRARQQSVLAAMQPQLDEASGVVGEVRYV